MTMAKVKVWDAPIRLFHWALVALIAFSWWSEKNDHMDWHRYSGSAVCGLLLFRLGWGLVGTSTARFRQFLAGPRVAVAYLRSRTPGQPAAGHNPLGGWSVVAMLITLATQVVSGMFAVDVDGIESGPLSRLVSFDNGRLASRVHGICFNLLLALIVLHLLAITFYLVARRRDLIGPMITGSARDVAPETAAVPVPFWRLAVLTLVSASFAWWVSAGMRF